MIPASGASPCATIAHPVESAFDPASFANMALTKSNLEDVLKTRLIVRETLKEFANAKLGGC